MPTSLKVKHKLLEQPLSIKPGIIYELGAGWGTLAFALAKKYPDLKVKAYETSPIPYYFCRLYNYLFPRPNLQFYRTDFFTVELKDASLIVCYLYPKAMEKLKEKLHSELKTGCVIVSHTFALPGTSPLYSLKTDDLYNTKIYIYLWQSER